MSLDTSYAGRTFPPTPPYQVGREKIREFARAIGATEAAYHDPEAAKALGHPDVIAPPTFPVVATAAVTRMLIDDAGLGLDFSRVLHGEQFFAYTRPVRAGDTLICQVTIEEITSRAGHEFLTTRTEITAEGGEHVVTVRAKLVVRGD
jgi:acyl dehydratase